MMMTQVLKDDIDRKEQERAEFKEWSDTMLNLSEFAVEATDFERSCLYKQHSNNIRWDQESRGLWLKLADAPDGRPIAITITFVRLDGTLMCFYHDCSQIVDYIVVEQWTKKVFPGRNTDAGNFHICLQELGIP